MSIELDLAILKTLITNKKQAIDFTEEFADGKMFQTEVWSFADVLLKYIRTYKDIPTLKILAEQNNKNSKLKETIEKTWNRLDNFAYQEKEHKHNIEKLKKRFSEHQISTLKDALNKMDSGIDLTKAMSEIQNTVQKIQVVNQNKTFDRRTLQEALPWFVDRINAKRANPKLDQGMKVGYTLFDYATNGVRPADFVLIAGESGQGKSVLLNNMAIGAWLQENTLDSQTFTEGKNIIYFSLEMPYEDCFNRLISKLSGVPVRRIENGELDPDDIKAMRKATDFIKRYPYQFEIIDIADASANDLETILSNSVRAYDAIFVDYLGIMRPNQFSNEEADWQKQGVISYELRAIARKYKIPMFSAVQLNRKGNAKDPAENIGLNRLARSASIATHSTCVIQIESRLHEENYPDFICHIIKLRRGKKLKFALIKNLACTSLLDNPSDKDNSEYFPTYGNEDISAKMDKLEL